MIVQVKEYFYLVFFLFFDQIFERKILKQFNKSFYSFILKIYYINEKC